MTLAERLRFCADQDGVSTDTHNELIECAEIARELVFALQAAKLALRKSSYIGREREIIDAALARAKGESK